MGGRLGAHLERQGLKEGGDGQNERGRRRMNLSFQIKYRPVVTPGGACWLARATSEYILILEEIIGEGQTDRHRG